MSSEESKSVEPEVVLPAIDLDVFLSDDSSDAAKEECRKAADGLHRFGILILKDSRANEEDNNRFIDLLERYFEQPEDDIKPDVHPELSFQVGATPSRTELPRDHCERMRAFKEADKPLSLCPPELDPKMRFFWRMGERPTDTKYTELNAEPVVPVKFPEWKDTMDTWGSKLLQAVETVAEMTAIGFDLPRTALLDKMRHGPHLLAPTASDFKKFGTAGTVLAGFHYDLNLMTIHGKSRFPGLYIWTRDGRKVLVRVPAGCLLLQAGKQFEYLTAGHVLAGFHEVVVVPPTVEVIERKKAAGESLWRISSTSFIHVASDQVLEPLGKFAEAADAPKYAPVDAGKQVQAELAHIKLGSRADEARK